MLKPLSSLHDCDPRFRDMVAPDAAGRSVRPLKMEDLHSLVAPLELSRAVPDEIRNEFDTARNAFVYSWFVYEFATLAEQRVFAVLELALRRRLDPAPPNTNKSPGLSKLLKLATDRGYLRRDDFAVPSLSGPGEMACSLDFLPMLRNHVAHGNVHLLPQGTLDGIRLCRDVIDALFTPESQPAIASA
jgi:hypothetical protein